MRVIGIDPGTLYTGYGIIEKEAAKIKYLHSGRIRLNKTKELPEKLVQIFDQIRDLVKEYKPNFASIEKVFYSVNVHTTVLLSHARSAAVVACKSSGLNIDEYSSTQIKKAVSGMGNAEKIQIQQMVKILLNLPNILAKDEADALAAAICHVNSTIHYRIISPTKKASNG